MKNVLIGIGGTGAKCVEATIHLSAAGLLPGETEVYLVDQDNANALSRRAHDLAKLYGRIHEIADGAGAIAAAPIGVYREILQPVDGADSSLERAFALVREIRPEDRRYDDAILAQALFTEGELRQDMKKGFVARPSIGSAAFVRASLENNDMWTTLADAVEANGSTDAVRVVLMGSIFGGTGAAGVPTLAQHLRRRLMRRSAGGDRLAAVLMLPYFFVRAGAAGRTSGFGPVDSGQVPRALQYYSEVYDNWRREKATLFDGLYLVGMDPMIGVADDSVGGGAGQDNPPLVPELIAALGACHFLEAAGNGRDDRMGDAWYCARNEPGEIRLADLPGTADGDDSGKVTRAALVSLIRFAFAFYHVYRPLLEALTPGTFASYPCLFRNLDHRESLLPPFKEKVKVLSEYCAAVLRWAGELDRGRAEVQRGLVTDLFDGQQFFAEAQGSGEALRFTGHSRLTRPELLDMSRIFAALWPEHGETRSLKEVLEEISAPPPGGRGHRKQLATFVARLWEATRVRTKGL